MSAQANAATTISLLILEGGAIYEAAKWMGSETGCIAIDVLAGVRSWDISTEINMDVVGAVNFADSHLSGFNSTRTIAFADGGTLQWVDPLIGLCVISSLPASRSRREATSAAGIYRVNHARRPAVAARATLPKAIN